MNRINKKIVIISSILCVILVYLLLRSLPYQGNDTMKHTDIVNKSLNDKTELAINDLQSDWPYYKNEMYEVSFQYPPTWFVYEEEGCHQFSRADNFCINIKSPDGLYQIRYVIEDYLPLEGIISSFDLQNSAMIKTLPNGRTFLRPNSINGRSNIGDSKIVLLSEILNEKLTDIDTSKFTYTSKLSHSNHSITIMYLVHLSLIRGDGSVKGLEEIDQMDLVVGSLSL